MFTPLTQAVGAMVEVPGDDFVFVAVGLFLDGVVENEQPVVRLDGADGRLHQPPQVAGAVLRPRQEPGELVMADLVVQQLGQARRGDQFQQRLFHGSRSTGFQATRTILCLYSVA